MDTGFDASMLNLPPAFDEADALRVADREFGLVADGARSLGSERDQAFLLSLAGTPVGVLKVSNAHEDAAILDMERLAAVHAAAFDPGLPIALPWPAGGDGRVRVEHGEALHWARLYGVMPGRARADGASLPDDALTGWGTTTARLGRALAGFFHPAARRPMPWDAAQADLARPLVDGIPDPRRRALVTAVLDRFDTEVAPRLGGLRSQVVHGDLTTDNTLVDERGVITGIVDFGDMTHTALVVDLASVLDSLCAGRGTDQFRAARLVLDGYQRITPLDDTELDVLVPMWMARAAAGIAVTAWRAERGLEPPEFAERFSDVGAEMIERTLTAGWEASARALTGRPSSSRVPNRTVDDRTTLAALASRRAAVLGPALEPLSYDEPIEMASADGVWMTAADGRRYLDAYNNVPCVGHNHPRVVSAVARQARRLNTNLRYLHPAAIELGERLVATMPDGLDTVMFVNSGSEANDLAWRIATSVTGNGGGLCTAHAYHGVTAAAAALSPEIVGVQRPAHIETWRPPDPVRGLFAGPAELVAALARLRSRDVRPAAAILDGVLQSDGVVDPAPEQVAGWVAAVRRAGGLWIADEVQGGHGRTGTSMWSFERFGIVPDLVTLGKPMGNGHPIAAVITRRELAADFARHGSFFSTFAGNPVAVSAATAVLDVLADERILPRVVGVGEELRCGLREVSASCPTVADVRGIGLANAVEFVEGDGSLRPAQRHAAAVRDGLRRRGVLVGTTGRFGNVLKVRPPLALRTADVAVIVDAFERELDALMRGAHL